MRKRHIKVYVEIQSILDFSCALHTNLLKYDILKRTIKNNQIIIGKHVPRVVTLEFFGTTQF